MLKKTKATQVRLDEDVAKDVDALMSKFGFRVSRASFVQTLIRTGMNTIKVNGIHTISGTSESTFKK